MNVLTLRDTILIQNTNCKATDSLSIPMCCEQQTLAKYLNIQEAVHRSLRNRKMHVIPCGHGKIKVKIFVFFSVCITRVQTTLNITQACEAGS